MTLSQKPEWIKTAEKKTSSFPRTISRALPVIALVVSTSILGVGAIFAHSAEESPVKAVEFSAPAEFDSSAISTIPSIENPLIGALPTVGEEDDDEVLGYEGYDDDEGDDDDYDDDDYDEDDDDYDDDDDDDDDD